MTMNDFADQMNMMMGVDQQQQQQQLRPAPAPVVVDSSDASRLAHLTRFAFLLSSARSEGNDEPVVGMHHDVEMAACFSTRHLERQGGMGMMMTPPPSISSSSLSISKGKNGGMSASQGMMAMGGSSADKKAAMLETAATNMSAPFYTTPDTVSSTAKTILKNIVTTMEELMDSRLRSTVSQLVQKAGGISDSPLLFRLLSPSRDPIQVATVITRFILPDENDVGDDGQWRQASASGDMVCIPLQIKAVLDVKIFGEVSTIELNTPVTMAGRFDPVDCLLTAVDVSFDCVGLLKTMISQSRAIVKLAVTKAATLSVQITGWAAAKEKKAATVPSKSSALSLGSLLGSTVSLNSAGEGSAISGLGNSGLFTTSFNSLHKGSEAMSKLSRQQKISRGLLKERSWGLGLHSKNSGGIAALFKNMGKEYSSPNNVNATFDLSGNGGGNACNDLDNSLGNKAHSNSIVRFQMPGASSSQGPRNNPPASTNAPLSSCLNMSSYPAPKAEPAAPSSDDKHGAGGGANAHSGLFSWLRDDKMFLTEEKMLEQNAAEAERERERLEAPMPLRFFTAAEDLGGGDAGLEVVSRSIFGREKRGGGGDDEGNKRRRVWQ